MLVGVAFFIGGIIATLILIKLLNKEQEPQPSTEYTIFEERTSKQPEMVKEFFTRSYTISDTMLMLDENSQEGLPWSSMDLTNNGPNPVYLSINNHDSMESPLPSGQTINIDFKQKQTIRRLFFRCNTGETANIRLYIVR